MTIKILRRLYELPPRESVRRIGARLRGRRAHWDIGEILATSKYMQSQLPQNFFIRYQTILQRACGWEPLAFAGRQVIEIGTGPMMGWAPLGVFLGADRYVCVEPRFNPAVINNQTLIEKVFLLTYKDLCALFGPQCTFDEFLERLVSRVEIVRSNFIEAAIDGDFDIALSNSCLEHISDLAVTIKKLAHVTARGGRFLHLVDFGTHRRARNPFDKMYGADPDAYFAKFGTSINLLRAPDVLKTFIDAGLDAVLVPYYSFPEFHNGEICEYWRTRYTDEELFLKAGIVAGPVAS